MAQIFKEITLDVAKKNIFQAILAKQYDYKSRFLKVTLTNDGEKIAAPLNATVLINAERPDKTSKSFDGSVNADGTVTVPLTSWILELDGTVSCDISLIGSDSRKLTSSLFYIEVETAANANGDIAEDENYDLLLNLISSFQNTVNHIPDDIGIEDGTIALVSKGQKIGEGAELPQITVDSELSAESENPVQNKVITNHINNNFSNAVKGTITGELLKIDDISPITHSLKMKAQSKNLIDFKQILPISTTETTIIENGFRITGIYYAQISNIRVLPNTEYTLSYVTNNISGTAKLVTVISNTGKALKELRTGTGGTFNSGDNTMLRFRFYASNTGTSQTVEFTNIQLEKGTAATEYKPYADVSDMTISRFGKNMLDFHGIKTVNPTVAEVINNGVRVTGTRAVKIYNIPVMPNTNYTLSFLRKNVTENSAQYVYVQGLIPSQSPVTLKNIYDMSGTFNTGNATEINVEFFASRSNTTETVEFTNIQLELGTEATEYEPYVPVIEANVFEDGTVEGITSAYPNTVIFGDTPNVVFECEYNVDLDKALSVDDEISKDSEKPVQNKAITKHVNNNFSNAVKGKVSGELLKIEDISPITHSLKMKAQSKNLIDFTQVLPYTHATPTIIDNGFRVTGGYFVYFKDFPVLPNTDYTLSYVTNIITGTTKLVSIFENSGSLRLTSFTNGTGGTFNTGDNHFIKIFFYASSTTTSQTVEFTNIQLELGTQKTDYTPYVDISDMTVRRYGKNMLNFQDIIPKSVTITTLNNGFRLDGTGWGVIKNIPVIPDAYYVLSYIMNNITENSAQRVVVQDADTNITLTNITTTTGRFTHMGSNTTAINVLFYASTSNTSETVEFTNIQLELGYYGAEGTEYEPYVPVIEANVSEDGTVEGIISAYPNTVIIGDTPNVVFDCEYNRDLNKVIDELTGAITALQNQAVQVSMKGCSNGD